MEHARIYTVPHGQPFLETLAKAILDGNLPETGGDKPSPLDLSDYTLLMPTRRAQRALGEAFLRLSGRRALLLPAIRPIADRDEGAALLSALSTQLPGSGAIGPDGASLPAAIDEMERLLLLTRLVQKWSEAMRQQEADPSGELGLGPVASAGARTPAQAAHLASELARLMDLVETEGASLDELESLVPDQYSEHWQKTLEFLKIITSFWPAVLADRGLVSPKERRNLAIEAEAARLSSSPPSKPFIVAGVTGSIPATVELIRAVSSLPRGAIVLPGLDLDLDRASWDAITPDHPEHPQFGLKRLLDRLGVDRDAVSEIAGSALPSAIAARGRFVSESMRPTGTTGLWHDWLKSADRPAIADGLQNVNLIEAANAPEEAEAISLIMREVAEDATRKVALVTPDRILARRVATRLEAWGIRVDDSAGRPFAKTVPGAFLELVIECVANEFAPADVMALLKHPLCRLELEAREVRLAARELELIALRRVYIGRGLAGLSAALSRARKDSEDGERINAAARRMSEDNWASAEDLIVRLEQAMAPLTAVFETSDPQPLGALAKAHAAAAEAVAELPEGGGGDKGEDASDAPEAAASPLYAGEAGAMASDILAQFINGTEMAPEIAARDYADLYRTLITGHNVLPRVAVHPRLAILGIFEARLIDADVVILGGLNDGVWPEPSDPGPWLNRPMRREMQLPSPEEAIGQSAHDFTALMGAPEVYLTRAKKIDGVPTVRSRWLMRFEALLIGLDLKDAWMPEKPWTAWARARDAISERIQIKAPEPRPPVGARPRKIGVSRVETWLANPYAIYASRVLRLEKLPDLGAAPDAALRGGLIHEALSRFGKRYPDTLPRDIAGELTTFAGEILTEFSGDPRVAAFWLPRFERFAQWFGDTEPARRAGMMQTLAEVSGDMIVDAPGGPFTLNARADRLDITERGLLITDYKTGVAPTEKKVLSGAAPQLPLEAAIFLAGGFKTEAERQIAGLRYIRASGADPAGEERNIKCEDFAALANASREGLARLIADFDREETPYRAIRRAGFSYDYDDYHHLARVAEWAGGSEGGDSDNGEG